MGPLVGLGPTERREGLGDRWMGGGGVYQVAHLDEVGETEIFLRTL